MQKGIAQLFCSVEVKNNSSLDFEIKKKNTPMCLLPPPCNSELIFIHFLSQIPVSDTASQIQSYRNQKLLRSISQNYTFKENLLKVIHIWSYLRQQEQYKFDFGIKFKLKVCSLQCENRNSFIKIHFQREPLEGHTQMVISQTLQEEYKFDFGIKFKLKVCSLQ